MALSRDFHLLRWTGEREVQVNVGGMLAGSSAFLLCCGPSLVATDLDLLRRPGVLVMGVNNAFGVLRNGKSLRGQLWLGADHPDRFLPSVLADPTIVKFGRRAFAGERVAGPGILYRELPNVFFWDGEDGHEARPSLLDIAGDGRIPWKHSSMMAALLVLARLGVDEIDLVGVDFEGEKDSFYAFEQDRTDRHHALCLNLFEKIVPPLVLFRDQALSVGLRVFNTNPASRLEVFPYRALPECVAAATAKVGDPALEATAGRYESGEAP